MYIAQAKGEVEPVANIFGHAWLVDCLPAVSDSRMGVSRAGFCVLAKANFPF